MILLLGGTGYIGQAFARHFRSRNLSWRTVSRGAGDDYTDPRVLETLIKRHAAEFVINAAGYSGKPNVDACEDHRAECVFANAVLPGRIGQACEATGTPWGHISSGCIYCGRPDDGSAFTEQDPPNFSFRSNNCSFYSGSKALGEEVLSDADGVYIWRLRIPFDHRDHPRNYLSKIMRYPRLVQAENSISHLGEFVDACLTCYRRRLPFGIYNVTNPGSVTTRRVTELIRQSGVCDKPFQFYRSETEFMQSAVKTPRSHCVLSSEKLAALGIRLRDVEQAISDSLRRWQRDDASTRTAP